MQPPGRFISPPSPSSGSDDRIFGIILLSVASLVTLIDITVLILVSVLVKGASNEPVFGVSTALANDLRGMIGLGAMLDLALGAINIAVAVGVMNSRPWAKYGALVAGVLDIAGALFGPFGICFSLGYILAALMIVFGIMRLTNRFGPNP